MALGDLAQFPVRRDGFTEWRHFDHDRAGVAHRGAVLRGDRRWLRVGTAPAAGLGDGIELRDGVSGRALVVAVSVLVTHQGQEGGRTGYLHDGLEQSMLP